MSNKNLGKVCWHLLKIRIRNPIYESEDPDPYQNITDPEQEH
jgi:hypothetical protein